MAKKIYTQLYRLLKVRPFCRCSKDEKELYEAWCGRIVETLEMLEEEENGK